MITIRDHAEGHDPEAQRLVGLEAALYGTPNARAADRARLVYAEAEAIDALADQMRALQHAGEALREACARAVEACARAVNAINEGRAARGLPALFGGEK